MQLLLCIEWGKRKNSVDLFSERMKYFCCFDIVPEPITIYLEKSCSLFYSSLFEGKTASWFYTDCKTGKTKFGTYKHIWATLILFVTSILL